MKFLFASFIMLIFIAGISSAQEDNRIQVIGDSLVGKTINGESIREVHGHVVMTQGAVRITCDKAIQYIARNQAELIGNVVVTQDSIIIKTDRGFYYGDTKIAYSVSGIWLTDGHVQVSSQNGYYYFDEKHSHFYGNVKLSDSLSTLTSDKIDYYDNDDKSIAVGNVVVQDTASTILADSLIHFRNDKITYAYKHVRIYDPNNKLAIFGSEFENHDKTKYSRISGSPFLVKIDTTSTGAFDTLMISSKLMESYDDSTKRLIATDSVRILRQNFSSVNGQTFYFQKKQLLQTFRRENDQSPPVVWNENTQLTGDSIFVYMKDNRLDWMDIRSNASIISTNKDSLNRFDQISGKKIKLFFDKDGLNRTEVEGNVLSIYYLYEDKEPNGLLKSSSERAKIFFKDKEVNDVRLYGKPASEYHPENTIVGKEKDFTIPTFKIFSDRPAKENLLFARKDVLSYLIKDSRFYAGKINPPKRKP